MGSEVWARWWPRGDPFVVGGDCEREAEGHQNPHWPPDPRTLASEDLVTKRMPDFTQREPKKRDECFGFREYGGGVGMRSWSKCGWGWYKLGWSWGGSTNIQKPEVVCGTIYTSSEIVWRQTLDEPTQLAPDIFVQIVQLCSSPPTFVVLGQNGLSAVKKVILAQNHKFWGSQNSHTP